MSVLALAAIAAVHHILPAEESPTCLRTYENGDAVANGFEPGDFLPSLTLNNLQDGDVVIKLVNNQTEDEYLYFVEPQSTAVIKEIEPGKYTLSFAVQSELAGDCRTLLRARNVIQFETPFNLYRRELPRADGSRYIEVGDNWATLHDTEGGAAKSNRISIAEFNRRRALKPPQHPQQTQDKSLARALTNPAQ